MKIANSAVHMAASSSYSASTARQARLEFWVGQRNGSNIRLSDAMQDGADISSLAKKLASKAAEAAPAQPVKTESDASDGLEGLSDKDKQKIEILDEFLYRLTGKHFKFRYLKLERMPDGAQQQITLRRQPQQAGYGLIYDYSETHSEQQAMAFQASGAVTTADGRTIDFSVALGMSREFVSNTQIHLRAGDAKVDPLVLNLGGGAPQLSQQKDFIFDIDNDGDTEQISRLLAGSGFLALDKNGDGAINDGGELFGPNMGDGFAELKTYDSDGNGWIDENDAVYDSLRVWMADEQGNMQLFALGQKGVGALYLGNVQSAFDINDAGNNSLGTVQSTGVYLNEDGSAGTMQHIDFTV